jgi:hypothetical protein
MVGLMFASRSHVLSANGRGIDLAMIVDLRRMFVERRASSVERRTVSS